MAVSLDVLVATDIMVGVQSNICNEHDRVWSPRYYSLSTFALGLALPYKLGDIDWLTFGYSRHASNEDNRAKEKPKSGGVREREGAGHVGTF